MKVLFHGSDKIVQTPSLEEGKPYNDYGRGLYCTEELEMAKEWACKKNVDGYVNVYNLDTKDLNILYLNNYNVLNWIAILLKNRTFHLNKPISIAAKEYILNNFDIDISHYDIIIGYRADDSYFSYADDFISNTISTRTLNEALTLGKLGLQTVLVSEKAFSKLEFVNYIKIDKTIYYKKYKERDNKARSDYQMMKNNLNVIKDDIFILDIIRKELKNNDTLI